MTRETAEVKFEKGFRKGDAVINETDRYVEVRNGYQRFIVGDNGERRLFWITLGKIEYEDKILSGDLSLREIKNLK
jgi:hypothetical protein